MDIATIKKDIFVAVINNGSNNQKERWKETAQEAYEWVCESGNNGTVKAPLKRRRRRKVADTA